MSELGWVEVSRPIRIAEWVDEHGWWGYGERDGGRCGGFDRHIVGDVRHVLSVEGAGGEGALRVEEEAVVKGKVDFEGSGDDKVLVVVWSECGCV